jgi:hypothetical protein
MKIVIPIIGAITIPGGVVVAWRAWSRSRNARLGFRAARTYGRHRQRRREHEPEPEQAGR